MEMLVGLVGLFGLIAFHVRRVNRLEDEIFFQRTRADMATGNEAIWKVRAQAAEASLAQVIGGDHAALVAQYERMDVAQLTRHLEAATEVGVRKAYQGPKAS